PCCNFFNVDGSFIMPEGWFGTTVAGYNAQIGGFLAGTEFSARFGNEGGSRTLLTNQSTAFGVTGQINRSYEFRSDAGLHIAGRIGWVFDRTLVFSKFGVGISHTVDKFEFAGSGSFCVRPGPGEGCNESVAIGSAIVDVARWSPSVVWGAGLEHNFDRFFVRADAELEAVSDRNINDSASLSLGSSSPATVSGNASKAILTTRGSAKLGIRF
ncbi:MAG TPA: hypothetical protein VET25_03380, partial [Aestuariivirgaceae bacterium]|nr:hypothetical protein [Aestuariivirgaceae bacterium]